jgi:predicted ATP-dependent endonuclease of OLD family
MSSTSGQLQARRNPMQVTISFLPVPLSLVRIPRSRLSKLTHPILRQILKPSPTFLSITCNQLELSIFAERDMLEDFEHIAKKDRRKRQARMTMPRDRNLPSQTDEYESIEISYDTWNVLQIDSHSNGLGESCATQLFSNTDMISTQTVLGHESTSYQHLLLLLGYLFYICRRT